MLAKNVVTADHISGGGRVELGMGTGWLETEHDAYGFPFPPTGERFDMLEEQIEIVRREWDEGSLDFEGEHYRIQGTRCRNRSRRPTSSSAAARDRGASASRRAGPMSTTS